MQVQVQVQALERVQVQVQEVEQVQVQVVEQVQVQVVEQVQVQDLRTWVGMLRSLITSDLVPTTSRGMATWVTVARVVHSHIFYPANLRFTPVMTR